MGKKAAIIVHPRTSTAAIARLIYASMDKDFERRETLRESTPTAPKGDH